MLYNNVGLKGEESLDNIHVRIQELFLSLYEPLSIVCFCGFVSLQAFNLLKRKNPHTYFSPVFYLYNNQVKKGLSSCAFQPRLSHMLKKQKNNLIRSDLLLDKWHDANPCEDQLATQALPRDAIGERLRPVGNRLAEVTHEERHVSSGGEDGAQEQVENIRGRLKHRDCRH